MGRLLPIGDLRFATPMELDWLRAQLQRADRGSGDGLKEDGPIGWVIEVRLEKRKKKRGNVGDKMIIYHKKNGWTDCRTDKKQLGILIAPTDFHSFTRRRLMYPEHLKCFFSEFPPLVQHKSIEKKDLHPHQVEMLEFLKHTPPSNKKLVADLAEVKNYRLHFTTLLLQ